MFKSLRNFWNRNGWFIIVIFCAISLVILYIYREENRIPNEAGIPLTEFSTINDRKMSLHQTLNAIMPKFRYEKKRKITQESRGERATRQALLKIYGFPFTKIRPLFLKNGETGKNLEIDAYNSRLRLGVEYNGRQHYAFTPGFHKSYYDFAKMQERDEVKRRKCAENGIVLIEIPYTVKESDIEKYLRIKLRNLGKL